MSCRRPAVEGRKYCATHLEARAINSRRSAVALGKISVHPCKRCGVDVDKAGAPLCPACVRALKSRGGFNPFTRMKARVDFVGLVDDALDELSKL